MKKILFTITILFAFSYCAYGQVQGTVGYSISETKNILDSIQNDRTLTVDARINLLSKSSKWVLAPAYSGTFQYDVEVVPDSPIYPNGLYGDVFTHFGGVELGYKIKKFEVGGGFFLAPRKDPNTMNYDLVRKYRGYSQVNLGYFVIRPFFLEAEASGGFNTNRVNRYGASAGVSY